MKSFPEPFKRADRVGEAIKAEIANILSRKIKDPRIGFVTVTYVQVNDDLRTARVYIAPSVEESGEELIKNLSHTVGYIRKELGKTLQLRYVPELIFKLESESPLKILDLLEKVRKEENEVLRDDHDETGH